MFRSYLIHALKSFSFLSFYLPLLSPLSSSFFFVVFLEALALNRILRLSTLDSVTAIDADMK